MTTERDKRSYPKKVHAYTTVALLTLANVVAFVIESLCDGDAAAPTGSASAGDAVADVYGMVGKRQTEAHPQAPELFEVCRGRAARPPPPSPRTRARRRHHRAAPGVGRHAPRVAAPPWPPGSLARTACTLARGAGHQRGGCRED